MRQGPPAAGRALAEPPALEWEEHPMSETRKNDPAYERARKRVEDLRGFYMHLLVYFVVNLGLFLLDTLTPGGPWFYWPLIGWGIGLLLHTVSVLLEGSQFSQGWEERKIHQLMDRERSRRPPRPPRPLAP